MPRLSRQQGKFLAALYNNSATPEGDKLDPQFLKGWLIGENPAGATSTPQHGNQNWLNIGNTDSKFYGQGGAYSNPGQAGKNTARWLRGEWAMPGFGRAAPSIVDFANTAGKGRQANIDALQGSGWASSGYPNLESIVSGAGAPGFLKYAKNGPRAQARTIGKAAQAKIGTPQVPDTPAGPKLSDIFTTLSNMGNTYDNPYAPEQDNYSFFSEIARVNEETLAQQQQNLASMLRRTPGSRMKGKHIKDVQPTDFDGQVGGGPGKALAFADARLKRGIRETGTNTGPVIDDWQRSIIGSTGNAWCGVFVGKGLQAAGVDVDPSIAGVDEAYGLAQQRGRGWEGVVSASQVQPGDVWFQDEHMGFVRSVNRRNGTITTVEGNASDAVDTNDIPIAGLRLARPAYKKGR